MDPAVIVPPILTLLSFAVVFWLILKFSSEKVTKQYRALAKRVRQSRKLAQRVSPERLIKPLFT